MDSKHEEIKTRIIACFKDKLTPIEPPSNELVFGLEPHLLREVATELKENKELQNLFLIERTWKGRS